MEESSIQNSSVVEDELSKKFDDVLGKENPQEDVKKQSAEASCSEQSTQDDSEDSETDDIDEEHLKTIEADLSEEEKEKRRDEAQSLKIKGNDFFKSKQYELACKQYNQALHLCPLNYPKDRAVLYSNKAACKQHLDDVKKAINDSTKALELDPEYIKARQRRAKLYEIDEKLDEALDDYKKILEIEPQNQAALAACHYLPPKIEERNEKLKTEMLGKLKDLGNMVLKPFGLSTENFQLKQDLATGNYSVNFKQNN